jgi:hypothetical protein
VRKLIFIFLLTGLSWAAAREFSGVSSAELLEQAAAYDGRTIVYQGEVIGDIMPRGENVWFNVSDGENALGIFAPRELAAEIQTAGKYRQIGDTVRIWGEFHRACSEHGGETDLHAARIEKIAAGYALPRPVSKLKIILSAILAVFVVVLGVLDRKRG